MQANKSTGRRRLGPAGRHCELLNAGLTVIREKGDSAKIGDIIAAAGAARGTFYVYFKDWSDYLVQLRDHLSRQLIKSFSERSSKYSDWRSFWHTLPALFVDLTIELDGLELLYSGSLAATAGEDELTRSAIGALVWKTHREGAMKAIDPAQVAPLVYAVVHETMEAVLRGADREAATRACGSFIVEALGVRAKRRAVPSH